MPNPKIGIIANSLWAMSASGWSILVTFFLTPFLIIKIGMDHYGLYMLLMSISGLLGVANLGLGEATLRYVSAFYEKRDFVGINRVIGSTLFIYTVVGSLVAFFFYISAGKIATWLSISPEELNLVVSALQLTALNFGLSFVTSVYSVIPQALLRFDLATKVTIVSSIFQIIGTVVILNFGYGLYHIVFWGMCTSVFTQIINVILAKKLIPEMTLIPKFSKEGLKEVFSYGIFSSLNGLIAMLSSHIDRILLATFVSPAAVAAFSIPKQILERSTALTSSASSVLLPKFSSLSDLKEITRIYKSSSWLLMTFTVAVFMPGVVFLPKFIGFWINPEMAEVSRTMTQFLCLNYALRGISEPYFAVLKGTGNIKVLTWIFVFTNLVSVALAFPLLYWFGLIGAGYRAIIIVWFSIPISAWVFYRFLNNRFVLNYVFFILSSLFVSLTFIAVLFCFEEFITTTSIYMILFYWLLTSILITILSLLFERRFFNYVQLDYKKEIKNYFKRRKTINAKI